MSRSHRTAALGGALLFALSGFVQGTSSRSLEVIHAFTGDGGLPRGDLARAADGTVYGVTQYGGAAGGSVYALVPDGAGGYIFRQLHAFRGSDGLQPFGGLILASDGDLYGTTYGSLPSGSGTVFRMDTNGNLTTLHTFNGADGGGPSGAVIEGGDGFFYGTTQFGGSTGDGTVYRVDAAGNFSSLHSFSGPDGREPLGHLYRAPNGDLYGTTLHGGDLDEGTVFRLAPSGALTTIRTFQGFPADGAVPAAGLTLGPDGNLYGSTMGGGDFGFGAVFRLVLPATVEIVYSFNGDDGSVPHAEILPDGSGGLVGTTSEGGAHALGTVFRLTVGGTLTTLHDFSGPDGAHTWSTVVAAPDGSLFTTAYSGGSSTSSGVVIGIDPLGTPTVLHDFRTEGATPWGPLLEASDGLLYGTMSGSLNGYGALFRLETSGAVTTFATLKDIAADYPMGGLAESGDGWFYGTAPGYWVNNNGAVYRAKLDGTFEMLHVFSGDQGVRPYAGLVRASDGHYYGTTHEPFYGSVFRIDGIDQSFSTVAVLDGTFGGAPCGRLVESAPGVLAATGSIGGPSGSGTVFEMTTAGSPSVVHGFDQYDDAHGLYPCSDIAVGSDGFFWGTTDAGGPAGIGTVFRLSTAGELTTLAGFHGPDGSSPLAGLAEAGGFFYGAASLGGAANLGTLFRVDASGRFESLYSFDGETGSTPVATMIRAADGFLYGTTSEGGYSGGVLYRLSVDAPAVTVSPTSGAADANVPITVTGSAFQANALVSVGAVPALTPVVQSDSIATATTPPLTPGTLNHVRVLNPDLSSSTVIEGWLADFTDVPQPDAFHVYVETLVRNHIAAGYGNGFFGRDDAMTRGQMAVVLLKAGHGSGYQPPSCTGVFTDVPCPSLFADWIEQLHAEGITGGCAANQYCPSQPVSRAQMAVFLLKGEHGSAYAPPPCAGVFADVACSPTPAFAADWIEQLYAEGITGGCLVSPLRYCPETSVTRGQMAVFLVRTFSLP